MTTYPVRQGITTFEEFLEIAPDGQKADLLDGVIYMASPDNTDAADLNLWLAILLYTFVDSNDLGKIYTSRVAYRLGPKQGPEPDIGFVPKELEFTRRRGYIDGPPTLAVEIVSPDSVARDYVQKRAVYESAGVREYWIIDPDEKQATFLRLRGGRYVTVKPKNLIFFSQVLPGFRIDVRWLWKTPRPRTHDVLRWMSGEEEIPLRFSKRGRRKGKRNSRH